MLGTIFQKSFPHLLKASESVRALWSVATTTAAQIDVKKILL